MPKKAGCPGSNKVSDCCNYVHPTGGWTYYFCFFRRPTFSGLRSFEGKVFFIALIHPIQWTIAYPVGADRPAKRQKKTSCVSTG